MEKVVSTDPIDCLGLGVRSYNLLRRAKIDTVGDWRKIFTRDNSCYKNFLNCESGRNSDRIRRSRNA